MLIYVFSDGFSFPISAEGHFFINSSVLEKCFVKFIGGAPS